MSPDTHASILVVDDDPRNLLVLRVLLENEKQNLVLAKSGDEALSCVLAQDFAVVLLDAHMPGLDGFATARMIRERPRSRHTPIIFLTAAYEDLPSMFRGYQAGAVDYIVKPLIPEVLKSKVAVFVELYNKNAVLIREVAERKRVEEHLRRSEENLRALAAHLQSVREEEWTRIAREIHDELGQALTGLKMDLTWVANRLSPDQQALSEKARSMAGLIDDTVVSVRKIASRLRPEVLDELGLAAAIRWQAQEFQTRAGIRCMVEVPAEALALDPERSTAAFRIVQELLTNVARHANATRVGVAMEVNADAMVLEIQDNGKGIAEADIYSPKALGILGMRERVLPFGGKIEFTGSAAQGTRATVSIPMGHAWAGRLARVASNAGQ